MDVFRAKAEKIMGGDRDQAVDILAAALEEIEVLRGQIGHLECGLDWLRQKCKIQETVINEILSFRGPGQQFFSWPKREA